LSPNMSLS